MCETHYTSLVNPLMLVLNPVTFLLPLNKQDSMQEINQIKTLGGCLFCAVSLRERGGENYGKLVITLSGDIHHIFDQNQNPIPPFLAPYGRPLYGLKWAFHLISKSN